MLCELNAIGGCQQLPQNLMLDYHWWNIGRMIRPNRGIPAQKNLNSTH